MHQLVAWSAVVLLLGCSKSDKTEPKTEPPKDPVVGSGSAAVAEPPTPALPEFDLAERLTNVGSSFAQSFEMAAKQGHDAVKAHCTEIAPLLRPSCYSGIAASYLTQKGAKAKDFEAAMAKINPTSNTAECQALGFATEDSPKLAGIAKELATDDCRANFWEGHGNQRSVGAAGEATAVCREEEGKKPDPAACAKQRKALASSDLVGTVCSSGKTKAKTPIPAGMETSCAHGVGQGLVFLLTDPAGAVEACGGKTQALVDACISGAAYAVILVASDRVDAALDVLAKLQPAQKAAFARGIGRALAYWKRQDGANLTTWLGAVPPPQRTEAERLLATHGKCTAYFDLATCEWQTK